MGGDDRTEAATPRKRSELRKRGQVARSVELSSMFVFLGLIVCLHLVGGRALEYVRVYLASSLAGAHDTALSPHVLLTRGAEIGKVLLYTVGPILLTAVLLGVLISGVQTGFHLSWQALKPDFTHLNPLTGFQRLLSGRGLFETVKAMAKLGIIGYIAFATISGSYRDLVMTVSKDIPAALSLVGDVIYRLALRIALLLCVLAAIDYAYQRYSFEKSIRMTRQEVKEEFKQQEGDPLIKSRIRARQRQLARRRMMHEVPAADVVITNPTHFAVALRYDAATMQAPKVIAKGMGLIARKIRDIAAQHDVPIVENPPLARALYKTVDLGREIPGEFYAAVAEILAYVYQINARRRQRV
jgi:flagellar biosynthetic protein FlhB